MSYKLRVKTITIPTAGIPVAGPDLRTKKVQILAPASNAGALYYGSDGVTAGIYRALVAGASDSHEAPNGGELDLSGLRFDAATSGDKVTLVYYEWQPGADPAYVMPKEVAGLLGWWKADALALANNAPVETWTDSSGNAQSLISYDNARPLYKTNVRNGLPGVLFDGVNDTFEVGLNYGVSTVLWASNFTMGGLLLWGDGDPNRDFICGGDGSYVIAERGAKAFAYEYPATWLNEANYFAVKFGATAVNSTVRRAGSVVTPVGEGALGDIGSSSVARNTFIGTRDGDFPIAGHLFELMIFNVALPVATIALLEAYLKQKWDL